MERNGPTLLSGGSQICIAGYFSCGISDDNYFTKLFKRFKGMTPMQFRQEKQFRR